MVSAHNVRHGSYLSSLGRAAAQLMSRGAAACVHSPCSAKVQAPGLSVVTKDKMSRPPTRSTLRAHAEQHRRPPNWALDPISSELKGYTGPPA